MGGGVLLPDRGVPPILSDGEITIYPDPIPILPNGQYPPVGTGWGPLIGNGWGTAPLWDWWGSSPPPPVGRQSSYAAGGMPLALTQENFLVIFWFQIFLINDGWGDHKMVVN